MIKTMIGIKILELTANGLVEIFELETEPISIEDDVRVSEAFDTMTKMFFEQDSIYLTTDHGSMVVRGMANKTIVLRAVFARETP